MKKLVLILLLIPVLTIAQSKRKKAREAAKQSAAIVAGLKTHVQYLADDKLEGRRTGTKGEEMAMQYLVQQYQQMGIAPKGSDGYVQTFEINEGKQAVAPTKLVVNGQAMQLTNEFFPLAYSGAGAVQSSAAVSLNEKDHPWFKDVRDWLEENKNNPHFDIEEAIKKEAQRAASRGALALILWNSGEQVDNIQFNKNDKSAAASIPVLYVTKAGSKKYFTDQTSTLQLDIAVKLEEKKRNGHNVIAFIDNGAPNTVILGAHYDHLGFGEDGNQTDPQAGAVVHNGADDNASGTAALLELAKLLKQSSPKNNNYLFMHFSGEELGLFGSKYWLEKPTATITPNYMINMDMVGRYDTARKLVIGGYGTSPLWGQLFSSISTPLLVKFDSTGSGPSDHASFYRKDIPVLFLFTGSHSDYHKATDDWDKINYDGQKDIVRLVYEVIAKADDKGKLAFTKTAEPQMGRATRFTVSLGVVPDYGYSGTGMRIDGASPGKLADKLGLKAGDVLLQLGDYKFVDVQSYMQSLSKFKKGDKTKLKVKRGNEELEFDVEF